MSVSNYTMADIFI